MNREPPSQTVVAIAVVVAVMFIYALLSVLKEAHNAAESWEPMPCAYARHNPPWNDDL
jgi:hypothetical protein